MVTRALVQAMTVTKTSREQAESCRQSSGKSSKNFFLKLGKGSVPEDRAVAIEM